MRRSTPRTLLTLVLVVALLLVGQGTATLPLLAQAGAATFDGKTISEIEFIGNRTLAEDTLRYYLEVSEGDTFSRARLDASIKRLWERELIDDISVEALSAEGGGVRLVVRVEERPQVRTVEYEGLKRISRTDLEDRLASERVQVREGGALNMGELYRIKAVIEEMYSEKGYRFAQANFRLEPVGDGERNVVFTIDEGDRVRIGDIRFEGNTVFRDARLRWEMKHTKESGMITRMFKKDIYSPAHVSEDLDRVRDLYREAGYKNVVLGEPQIQVKVENPKAPPEKQTRRLVITVPVEEGNRWKFGEVSVEGNEIFPEEPLVSVFKYRPGAWLRSDSIDEGVEAIKEVYSNTGYIQAQVTTELVERSEEVADVIVHVREGDQFQVGRIEFEGNTRTRDKVLRREFRVQEGRVLSLGALKNSLYKIRQLGYFELDEEDPIEFDFQEDNRVNLKVKGAEADRTELQFGAGFSEGLGFFGQLSLRTQNFLGRGERVGMSLQSGALTEFYELSYFVPWFLDRPQSLGFQGYDRSYDYDLLSGLRTIEESTGGAVSYARSLGLFQSLGVSYSYSDQFYRQERDLGDDETSVFETALEISSLRPTYTYNSVDNRFEPRRGTKFQGSLEYAGGVLGGSEYFVRPTVSFTHYRPLTGYPLETVLGLNFEAGLIEPFGGRDLERFTLFRLGGDTSVRGFERYRLYSRDEETGEFILDENGFPVGGDRFIQFNLEYHVLVSGPFRVIAFVDAGQVFAPSVLGPDGEYSDSQSFDLSRLRYTAGAELRITLPVLGGAPLRFIWANNLNEELGDEFNSFSFSIGSTF